MVKESCEKYFNTIYKFYFYNFKFKIYKFLNFIIFSFKLVVAKNKTS